MVQTSTVTLLVGIAVLRCAPTESKAVEPTMYLQLERFEQIGGEHIIDASNVRVRKYNRTVYILDGTLRMLQDLDGSYEVAVRMAYSTLGNNQFNEYPMKLPQKSICRFMVDEYVEYQYIWGNSSNLPRVEFGTRAFCPFPKGEYWFHEMAPESSFMPLVVPVGLWRMTLEFRHPSNVVVLQQRFYYRVTKGYYGRK